MTTTPPAHAAEATILLVEDDVLLRMSFSQYLRECGYKVVEAVSADEAMTVLQHQEITIDVVFSNVELPGVMDGFALSKWIRDNRPDTQVILVGSVPGAADAAAELCDDGPLPKPYEPQIMVDRIRRLIARRKRNTGAGAR